MRKVQSVDGTEIAYNLQGSGDPVVFVHGACGSRGDWLLLSQLLDAEFTVVAMDRRGRGDSGDASDHSLAKEVDDVLAVIEDLGGSVHLFGHSYGAICSLEAASRGADLRSLTLYEPPIGHVDEEAIRATKERVADGDLEATVEGFLPVADIPDEQVALLKSITPVWEQMLEAAKVLPRELDAVYGYTIDEAAIAKIEVPVLLLAGAETEAPCYDGRDRLEDLLPNARTAFIPGQRHVGQGFAPNEVAEIWRGFVASTG